MSRIDHTQNAMAERCFARNSAVMAAYGIVAYFRFRDDIAILGNDKVKFRLVPEIQKDNGILQDIGRER